MSRSVPTLVAVYRDGQSIKTQSTENMSFAAAMEAVERGEGIFRDKRRKLVIFRRAVQENGLQAIRAGSAECNRAFVEKWYGQASSEAGC